MTEMPQFTEVPESVRKLVKSNLDQGKKTFDTFVSAGQQALVGFEAPATVASEGLKSLNDKLAGYARLNTEKIFQHAIQLADTRQFSDAVDLQNAHIRETMDRLTRQFDELREMASGIMKQTARNVTTTIPGA